MVSVRIYFRNTPDSFLYGFNVQEWFSHTGIVYLELIGIARVESSLLNGKFHLTDNLISRKVAIAFHITCSTKLASYRTSAHCRNANHPAFGTTSQVIIVKEVLFPSYRIFRVVRKKRISRLYKHTVFKT